MSTLPLPLVVGLAAAVMGAVGVFVAAFRFAMREGAEARLLASQPDLPRATLHASRVGGARWHRGAGRQRALRSLTFVQAGFVALGVTSVFVMSLCLAAMIGVMVLG